jgi:prepilin-type N-terminal cleavage/methylation domain-containing protein
MLFKIFKVEKNLSSKNNIRIKVVPNLMCGFTLIELMVSIALFTVVSLIGVGALLTVIDANRKSQSLKSVVNNLTFGLESLSKNMRVGTTYHCDTMPAIPPYDSPQDCAAGGDIIAYEKSGGDPLDFSDQTVYRLNGTKIERSSNGGLTFQSVTSDAVEVTNFKVFVFGSGVIDGLHPRVVIVMRGNVNFGKNAKTEFDLQTSISQRELDG